MGCGEGGGRTPWESYYDERGKEKKFGDPKTLGVRLTTRTTPVILSLVYRVLVITR